MNDNDSYELQQLRRVMHLNSLGDRPHSMSAEKLSRMATLEAKEMVERYNSPAPSPSYTLGEIRSSMEEFLNDMQTRGHATVFGADSLTDWKFETYLQWLAKRERADDAGSRT